MFKALLLEESDGKVSSSIQELDDDRLPEGDVTVAVDYSTLNYKDGMIVKGIGRLVRTYPHVPGVDFAGTVAQSSHADFKEGDKVVLTGWRVGEVHWGGYAQKARVKGDWLVPLPDGLSSKQAMANLVGVGGGMRGVNRYGVVLKRHQHGINTIHAGARHQTYPGFHSAFSRLKPMRVAGSSRGKRQIGRCVVR